MELRQHLAVAWRFRFIIATGVIVGIVVAILASFSVSGSGLKWRSDQTLQSDSTLFVTQTGFPWGRVTLPTPTPGVTPPPAATNKERREYGQPERFSDLAVLYSYLASSSQVYALIQPRPPKPDQIVITPVLNEASGAGLPLLKVNASANTGAEARRLNAATIEALRKYLEEEQARNGIDEDQRVQIQVVNPPGPAKVTEGRSYLGSVIAFILAVAGAFGLAYLLENLRPRKSPDSPADLDELELAQAWDDALDGPVAERPRTAA
jgi:hypothetical protein